MNIMFRIGRKTKCFAKEDFKLQRKRIRTFTSADIDKKLYSWFLQRRLIENWITDNIWIEKAITFQEERGSPSYLHIMWLWRYKKNYNLRLANIHGESDNAGKSAVEKFKFYNEFKPGIRKRHLEENCNSKIFLLIRQF